MSTPTVHPAPGSLRHLAVAGARASWTGAVGTGLVLALASALTTLTGALLESGLREPAGGGGMLVTLASSFAGTALVLVVVVVAATTTLALRRRRRELALLRAVGATRGQVRRLVSTELLLLGLVAVPAGAVPGLLATRLLDPVLRDAEVVGPDFTSSLSPFPVLGAVVLLVPTAMLAGLLAARETVRAAPTAAIAESAAEATPVGAVRRAAALLTALAGLAAAGTPLLVPGTVGGALAATSAFLLIGAAALAGPVLVEWVFGRAARIASTRSGAPTRLALGNLRGFSRRLTTVVVPLALVVAVGTTQSTVDRAVQRAATEQLAAALGTDVVATSAGGLGPAELAALSGTPGVTAVTPLADAPAEVRTDDDADLPDSLVWEAATLRAVQPDVDPAVFDPGVTDGDLASLGATDSVAVSSDAAFETGRGVGDTLDVRLGGTDVALEVVAVYDRGLGVGDLLVSPATLAKHGVTPAVHLALVSTETPGSRPSTSPAGSAEAVATTSTDDYVGSAGSADAASQRLSTLLTLALLLFVGLGALNALVLLTAGRRAELRLLHRGGATARQLLTMTGVEAAVTGLVAWAIGTLAVLPAVVGVSAGLLGAGVPVVDLPTYAVLSGLVLALTVAATLLTATRTVRGATSVAR
ncbi:FtsX-like permease family protein [Nocardioides dongxiaopingii]|uniref:FtsX-like permease family protein n=1 Tax=Nocardioides sp. S-1144 TaxID=2582905 RepID=UPI0011625DD7|nr:ABC transporter permease [Nocardioides sp. S-1144]QDH10984.1 FtsX-like permease family protein [Nocardioides sp. S-1144]